jgi:hypothetical protein
MKTIRIILDIDDPDGYKEVNLEITYSFYPGHPVKNWGPPEDCYEAEDPEIELLSVIETTTNQPILNNLSENDLNLISDVILSIEKESNDDYY